MNGLYDILLFLFILGSVTQGFNEVGVFGVTVPDAGLSLNETSVTEIQDSANSVDINDYSLWNIIAAFMRVIGAGVVAMFTIVPLCVSIFQSVGLDLGLSLILAGILQAPVTLVTLFGLYEWWRSTSVT